MIWPKTLRRITAVVALTMYLGTTVPAYQPERQRDECACDRSQPRLNNARNSFGMADYDCAFFELKDLLRGFGLSSRERAEANFLLSAVYYRSLNDRSKPADSIRCEVMSAALAGYAADTGYTGNVYIQSSQYRGWLSQAKAQVIDSLRQKTVLQSPPTSEGKPLYKKRWFQIAATVTVAGLAIAFWPRNGDGLDPDESLPYFPDPPGDKQ